MVQDLLGDPVFEIVFDDFEVELATNELHVDLHLLSYDPLFQKIAHISLQVGSQLPPACISEQFSSVFLLFLFRLSLADTNEAFIMRLDL